MDRTLRRTSGAIGIAVLLAAAAMFRYPGGTPLDPVTSRYDLSHNFLSDLGMTVAYNHEPNRLGATLFVASLALLILGAGGAVLAIARSLAAEPKTRRWTRVAAAFALLASLLFVGVAFTPENLAMDLHVTFTCWAWRMVPFVALAMAFASRALSGRTARIWFVGAGLLAIYVGINDWGPSAQTPSGLVVQVIAQKAATVVLIVVILLAARARDVRA